MNRSLAGIGLLIVVLGCQPAAEQDATTVADTLVHASSGALAACVSNSDSARVVYSDFHESEETGDFAGSAFRFVRVNGVWHGEYEFGEGGRSGFHPLDSLRVDEMAGTISFVQPAILGNLAVAFDGLVSCDSLVGTARFGRVEQRSARARLP